MQTTVLANFFQLTAKLISSLPPGYRLADMHIYNDTALLEAYWLPDDPCALVMEQSTGSFL